MRIDKIREEDLDGEVKTYKLNTIKQKIVYIDENDYKKKEKALKKYLISSYKHLIFKFYKKDFSCLDDGMYKEYLPVSDFFEYVYGKVYVSYSKKGNTIILENIQPSNCLLDFYNKDPKEYKGMYYRNNLDKLKIDKYIEMKG